MNNRSSEELVLYPKLGKVIFLSPLFILLGAMVIYFGLTETETTFKSMMMILIGIACILVFGLTFLYGLNRKFNKDPFLVVNDEGILDQSTYTNGGFIKWEEIEDIFIYRVSNQRMIGIRLYDPESVLNRMTGLKGWLARMSMKQTEAPVNIPSSSCPVKLDDLYMVLVERWQNAFQPELEPEEQTGGQTSYIHDL